MAAPRARLPLRLRRRLRAERRHLRGGPHGPGDGRDHDRPSRHRHARAEDRRRDAASDHGCRPRDRRDRRAQRRSWPRPSIRGSGRRRTSSARCTAATSTTASRPSAASSARAAGRPGNTLEAVEAEFLELLEPIAAETGCSIELDLRLVRGAYSIDPEHELLARAASRLRDVTGTELPLEGIKVVADAAVFQGVAAIPTVYHGPAGSGATRTSSSCPSPSSCARRRSIWPCSSTCGPRELAAALLRRAPLVVSVAAPRRRQHRRRGRRTASRRRRRRSSSPTGARSPARSPSAS